MSNTSNTYQQVASIASGDIYRDSGPETATTEAPLNDPTQKTAEAVEIIATGASADLTTTDLPAWQRYQNGDETASKEVLDELSDTISRAVSGYAGNDPQMMTRARILALEAVKTYDPSRGAQLSTYVYGQLQKLRREAAQRGNLTHVPENVAIERSSIARVIREYRADHGEDPTTEQLADITGLPVKRIDAVMNYKPVVPDSVAVSPEGDSLVMSETERALDLYDRLIYAELDDIDKRIYEWVTGYGKGEILSQVEIARRLGITPAAVSKRYKQIADKFASEREIIRANIGA